MMPLSIIVRPERLYHPDGSRKRGARRTDNIWSRTLALFDIFGITRRKNQVVTYLSDEGYEALKERAGLDNVHIGGLASFLLESEFRDRPKDRCHFGHALTPDNTIIEKGGARRCRMCRRAYFKYRNDRLAMAAEEAEALAS